MVIVFDLNGTLLDTRGLKPALRSIFGPTLATEQFVTGVLQYSMALTLSGEYRAFSDIAVAVLRMEADSRKIKLSDRAVDQTRAALSFSDLEPPSSPVLSHPRMWRVISLNSL